MRTPEVMHKIMSSVHSKDTRPERKLRKALWKQGIRYRKNYKNLPGKPDIAITRCKIAIFVDGDFWHGRNIKSVKTNREYWMAKFKRNQERDREINDLLTEMGWMVMRFWESDLKNDFNGCVNKILEEIPFKRTKLDG